MRVGIILFIIFLIVGIIIVIRGRHTRMGVILLVVLLIVGSIVLIKTRQHRILENTTPPIAEEGTGSVLGTTKNPSVPGNFTLGPGSYEYTLKSDAKERKYLLYVPSSYNDFHNLATAVPLVLFFHGGGGDMEQAAADYGLKEKADKEGFIVAFPNGDSRFPRGKLATWNAGDCCGYARDTKSDDVGFTRAVIGDIESKFFIDKDQIFATGMSNGGMMAHRLACEMADTFKAVASVAGTDNTVSCNPSRPISVLHIQAKNDDHVLFNGGAGPDAFRNLDQVNDFTSVPETIARWVARDQMNAQPTRVLDKAGAYCDLYTSSVNDAQVKLCVTDTGGHSWPGGRAVRGKTPSQAISANDIIWDFFKSQKK